RIQSDYLDAARLCFRCRLPAQLRRIRFRNGGQKEDQNGPPEAPKASGRPIWFETNQGRATDFRFREPFSLTMSTRAMVSLSRSSFSTFFRSVIVSYFRPALSDTCLVIGSVLSMPSVWIFMTPRAVLAIRMKVLPSF